MKNISNANNSGARASLFVIYWLCVLAGLLAWKGSAYSEIVIIRKYLGMTEPSTSLTWWAGAAGIAILLIVWTGCLLFRWTRCVGEYRGKCYSCVSSLRPTASKWRPEARKFGVN